MSSEHEPRRPGRPQKITRAKIAAAGRKLTLPGATVAGIAEELGVGVRALYKHTDGIRDIQIITAEEIFAGWEAPEPGSRPLEEHLMDIAISLRRLAIENPGIAGFLVRNSHEISPKVQRAMDAHQQRVAGAYGLGLANASLLIAAVAEHALSVTDVVHSHGGRVRDVDRMLTSTELPALSAAARETGFRRDEEFFEFSTKALVTGLLALLALREDEA
ncbi:hypothetical protein [Leucobacter sp.]